MKNLNKLRGEVADKVILHRNKFGNTDLDPNVMKEVRTDLRKLSSELRAKAYLIKHYKFLSKLGLILPKENIFNASGDLMGLSNSVHKNEPDKHQKRVKNIEQNLDISL